MEALIDAEVERMRASPRNNEMASNLDPPSLPWKESRWIHGPPGMRGAIGRGPQGDRGVLVSRPLPSGRNEIKMVRGRDTRDIRLEWQRQTSADQWSNLRYPTLRPRLRIVDPLERWRHWALRLRAAVHGRNRWTYEQPRSCSFQSKPC